MNAVRKPSHHLDSPHGIEAGRSGRKQPNPSPTQPAARAEGGLSVLVIGVKARDSAQPGNPPGLHLLSGLIRTVER